MMLNPLMNSAVWRRHSRGMPNKPVVPTAPTSLDRHALPSRRPHIGQPFGSRLVDDRCRIEHDQRNGAIVRGSRQGPTMLERVQEDWS